MHDSSTLGDASRVRVAKFRGIEMTIFRKSRICSSLSALGLMIISDTAKYGGEDFGATG